MKHQQKVGLPRIVLSLAIFLCKVAPGWSIAPADRLSLPQLDAFDACTVQIILTELNFFETESQTWIKYFPYEPEAFRFPVIFSRHYFVVSNVSEDETHIHTLKCNDSVAILDTSKSNFIFRLPPSPRQNCVVQVYIDPPKCQTWKKSRLFPLYKSDVKDVLGETLLDPVFNFQLSWRRLLQQSSSFAWTFIHCLTGPVLRPMTSRMEDIVSLIRTDLREAYNSMPTLPVTLVVTISSNTTPSGARLASEAYIVSEIENIEPYLENLKEKVSILDSYYDINTTANLSSDHLPVFYWYRVSFHDHILANIWENHHLKLLNSIYFYHQNNFPVTSKMNIYPTNWNPTMFEVANVILSLLFKPNQTGFHEFEKVEKSSQALSYFQTFMQTYFPGCSIMGTRTYYPSFRDRNEDHFVTCMAGGHAALSLKELVSAFDWLVWLFIFLSTIATVVAVQYTKPSGESIYNHIPLTYKVLLAQPINEDRINSKLILGCWILIAVVLSNAYQGENVCKLTAPLALLKIDSFEKIIEMKFAVFSPLASHFKMFPPEDSELKGNWKFYTSIGKVLRRSSKNSSKVINQKLKLVSRMWSPQTKRQIVNAKRRDNYFDFTLAKCRKTAFVAEFPHAINVYRRLRERLTKTKNIHLKYLTISKNPLESTTYKIAFYNFPMPAQILSVWQIRVVDSGLLKFWTDWDFHMRGWRYVQGFEEQTKAGPTRMTMNTNISVVFMLASGLLFTFAVPVFIAELAWGYYHRTRVIVLDFLP